MGSLPPSRDDAESVLGVFLHVLGVVAFAGPRLANDSLHAQSALLVSASLALGLQLLAGFLFLMVARLNEVARFYQRQIVSIDKWISAGASVDFTGLDAMPRARRTWAEHGRLAERVLQVALFTFFLVSVGVFVRSIDLSPSSITAWACGGAVVLTAVVGVTACVGRTQDEADAAG